MKGMEMKFPRSGTALLAAAALLGCGGEELAGRSGGDETSNGIAGRIVDGSGRACAGDTVRVRPYWYLRGGHDAASDPAAGVIDLVTDSLGGFRVERLPPGSYRLEVRSGRLGLVLAAETRAAMTDIGTNVVLARGAVDGQVALPEGSAPAVVQVYGLERQARTDASGRFLIHDLPAGELRLRVVADGQAGLLAEARVVVVPSSVVTANPSTSLPPDPQTWNRAARVTIDPYQTGSNEALRDVPVLLRFDGSRFPFGQARSDGSDLRAEDSLGRPVPLDVAAWDPEARTGRVWIRLDELRRDAGLRSIRLTWGGSRTGGFAGPAFDTAAGWSGVWHLSRFVLENGDYRSPDATQWRQDARLFAPPRPAGGPVGEGLAFDGIMDGLAIGGRSTEFGARDFTWEAWVKSERPGAVILQKSVPDSIWMRSEKKIYLGQDGKTYSNKGRVPTWLSWGAEWNGYSWATDTLTPDGWMHLTVRGKRLPDSDSSSVEWFVDGRPVTRSRAILLLMPDRPSDSLFVWDFDPERRLRGGLDELRVSRLARSDAWIQFVHESERPGSTVVRIGPAE